MYEWRLTNLGEGGFNKSYDQTGKLTVKNVFDDQGRFVEKIEYQ